MHTHIRNTTDRKTRRLKGTPIYADDESAGTGPGRGGVKKIKTTLKSLRREVENEGGWKT